MTVQDQIDTEVLGVEFSKESIIYLRVKIRFTNPGPRPVKMKEYILTWTEGRKVVVPDDPVLGAGASRVSQVRVTGEDGKLDALTRDTARVEAVLK